MTTDADCAHPFDTQNPRNGRMLRIHILDPLGTPSHPNLTPLPGWPRWPTLGHILPQAPGTERRKERKNADEARPPRPWAALACPGAINRMVRCLTLAIPRHAAELARQPLPGAPYAPRLSQPRASSSKAWVVGLTGLSLPVRGPVACQGEHPVQRCLAPVHVPPGMAWQLHHHHPGSAPSVPQDG